jgi:hypothetical protein
MPSDTAVDFVRDRALQRAALRDASVLAERSGSPIAVLSVLAQNRAEMTEVVGAEDSTAALRTGPPRESDGSPIEMDGYNMKPGTPEYQRAIQMNNRNLRRLKASGEIVEIEEPDQLLSGAAPEVAPAIAQPTTPAPVVGAGKRVMISFGPREGTLIVSVEEGDEVPLSITVDIAAAKAFKPVLMLLARVRDMTGGALNEQPAAPAIQLGPASEPTPIKSRRKAS